MALQPSTQSWRVIWVRDGKALSWAMERFSGRLTRPSTTRFQSLNPLARAALVVVVARHDRAIGP